MTNTVAIALGALILLIFILDALAFGGGLPVFLGLKLANLIEYLAFWR
ncbi:hypothetical protein [Frigidibacter sp.]|nr:hypothetical protein [Frigidibacter sp.]MDP3340092.1 hypothetical protein [Frigidibacter sp.]